MTFQKLKGDGTRAWENFMGLTFFPLRHSSIERPLRERGAIQDVKVGAAISQLVPGSAVIEVTVALLAHDPAALLCTDPGCFRCSRARARLA